MLTYWNYKHGLQAQENWQPNYWVQATCPTEEEEKYLIDELHIPDYFLNDIRDKDERARYDYDEGWMLIILRIPYQKEAHSRTPHTTIPLGVLLNREVCVSVCHFETDMMIDFVSEKTRLRFHRLCRLRLPPLPLECRLVPETPQTNQHHHR